MPNVQFLFDFGSPNAYLSHLVIPEIEERTGTTFELVPVLLGGVFKLTNNVSPMVALQGIKNKPEFQQLETHRFLERHRITDFQRNPHFPLNSLAIMRGAVYAQSTDYYQRYVDEVFRQIWSRAKKMDDPEVIRAALVESDLPADEIFAGAQDPAVKQKLIDSTQRAVDRGVFGSPSFFVDDELFFGKDQLPRVEDEILRRR